MITTGMKGSFEVIADDAKTAKTMKSGSLEVFATPALVAALEAAAVAAVEKELDDGYTTVGCSISITHTAPSIVGSKIIATATVKEIIDRRIVFNVTASDENGIIGEGEHIRAVVNKAKFMSKAIIRSESDVK